MKDDNLEVFKIHLIHPEISTALVNQIRDIAKVTFHLMDSIEEEIRDI